MINGKSRLVVGMKAGVGGVEIRLPTGETIILGITQHRGNWVSMAVIAPIDYKISRLNSMKEGDYEQSKEEREKRS